MAKNDYSLLFCLAGSASANQKNIEDFAVTPWLYVGADLQYVNPAGGSYDNALVGSLRTQIRF